MEELALRISGLHLVYEMTDLGLRRTGDDASSSLALPEIVA